MTMSRPAAVIVLAAGEGTRMKSRTTPKVLHELGGRSLVGHVLAAARDLRPERLVVVVGHGRDKVAEHLAEIAPDAVAVTQEQQNGTGHAVRIVLEAVGALTGTVVVTNGDHPLLRGETLAELVRTHEADGNAVTVLSTDIPDPTGYGRIVRGPAGEVAGIVEHKDAGPDERAINEINVGMYVFDGKLLSDALGRVTTDNASGEEYLTDVVGILRGDGHRAGAYKAADWVETQGVNDRVQLAQARRQLNDRVLEEHMRAGVTIVDPLSTWVDVQVTLEPDVVVEPNTQLRGGTHVAAGARIGPNSTLTDTSVGEDATVVNAVCVSAEIGPEVSVGPFAYLRPGTRLARKAKIGTYVETKNAVVGEGSKVPHLTYVGDAEIGEGSNIGAACVFVNYDGVNKSRSVVGNHVKVGSDNMIVAPVTIGDGAYTAAGSVITNNVPPGAMAVARARQRNVEGWVQRKRAGTPSAEAAQRAREQDGQDSE
ncbi:bifunctional UDP-N-acetylglucosamine diphosphorylase/glucosamine-1-phosphate N-acetyltransferase GlmU [Actinoallomurus rhizosphaericola]|uniref:bifunctional UDP-N-acetylglucosamine diphosphorylase/glucosamine-1-phosphate N-acetyltransferase GlmU n=1 Tax=Actinoallomurus rhizosphaericola TaxID=2952536 RepID=UPI002090F48C|nr:bifunctional UDP-N-acetylglucosamine diphosphorylase/glucosamine-1-phosphate N-acetyltransferase GlmU [Actinoallomurus rhizosphaericola]MCO5992807.1 bifunctional UDP-N-acetylglucosamine diphosphorylase/glucosamine-1-phosphate N-acetyltransferase GlmU [Actinoallomurus rhizosphaericola]